MLSPTAVGTARPDNNGTNVRPGYRESPVSHSPQPLADGRRASSPEKADRPRPPSQQEDKEQPTGGGGSQQPTAWRIPESRPRQNRHFQPHPLHHPHAAHPHQLYSPHLLHPNFPHPLAGGLQLSAASGGRVVGRQGGGGVPLDQLRLHQPPLPWYEGGQGAANPLAAAVAAAAAAAAVAASSAPSADNKQAPPTTSHLSSIEPGSDLSSPWHPYNLAAHHYHQYSRDLILNCLPIDQQGNNVLRGHSPPPLAHRLPSTHSPHPPLQDKHRLRPGSRGGDSGSGGSSPAFRAGGSSPAFRGGTSSPAFRGVGGGQGQLLPGAGGQGQLLPGMTASFLPPPMLHQFQRGLPSPSTSSVAQQQQQLPSSPTQQHNSNNNNTTQEDELGAEPDATADNSKRNKTSSPSIRSLKSRILHRSEHDSQQDRSRDSIEEKSHDPMSSSDAEKSSSTTILGKNSGAGNLPPHFTQGSLIQLADGSLKKVEHLVTEDFLRSADSSPDVRIESSAVVRLEQSHKDSNTVLITFSVGGQAGGRFVQVTVEAAIEHPFYVFDRGWASFSPELTLSKYSLNCSPLKVGDVCISLTHKVDCSQLDPDNPPALVTNNNSNSHNLSLPVMPALVPVTSSSFSSTKSKKSPPVSSPVMRYSSNSPRLSTVSSRPLIDIELASSFGARSASSTPTPTSSLSSSRDSSKSSPKQVGFNDIPSVYRINTDSPPNQREPGINAVLPLNSSEGKHRSATPINNNNNSNAMSGAKSRNGQGSSSTPIPFRNSPLTVGSSEGSSSILSSKSMGIRTTNNNISNVDSQVKSDSSDLNSNDSSEQVSSKLGPPSSKLAATAAAASNVDSQSSPEVKRTSKLTVNNSE